MKNFIGKMLNMIGVIGNILVNCFFVAVLIITLTTKKTIMGDFLTSTISLVDSNIFIILIIWLVTFLISIIFYIFDLRCLIQYKSIKLVSFCSLAYFLLLCVFSAFLFLIKVHDSESLAGLNMSFILIYGVISLFSSLLILMGNILNLGKNNL